LGFVGSGEELEKTEIDHDAGEDLGEKGKYVRVCGREIVNLLT